MAGLWYRTGSVSVTQSSKKITGSGTSWQTALNRPSKGNVFYGPDGKAYEIDYVSSETELYLVDAYAGAAATGQSYKIDVRGGTVPELSRQLSEHYAYMQGIIDSLQSIVSGSGDVTITGPSGQTVTVPALANMLSKSGNLSGLSAPGTALSNLGVSTFIKTLLDDADAATARATLGAQDSDATLTALAGVTTAADKLPYFTGVDSAAVATLTAFARTLLDDADASTMRSTLGLGDTESGSGALMRVGGPAILDAERYALERATGGRQTIIRDSAGNANAMFVLTRFSYADLGMTADMGTGDVTAFDFGSGSIKSEIFIGAYLASGSGAVSAPRQDPRTSLDHTSARNACRAKGAGWHLMTAHEWAAIALWCMANGYEPIGNTNWGRSNAKTWIVGDRADNRAPGDAAGTGRTQTGSMGSEATHTRTLGGIADLVGNVWEWQDGLLLQDGRFKISAYNTQAEVDWAFADAFLDASTPTGGSAILSNAVNNRLGAIGDNANAGNSANVEWRAMTKSGSYVSNQAMKRLLLEPAGALPQGRIYMRNFGERLPSRGGSWHYGANAGLAGLALSDSRAYTDTYIGFRPAFA